MEISLNELQKWVFYKTLVLYPSLGISVDNSTTLANTYTIGLVLGERRAIESAHNEYNHIWNQIIRCGEVVHLL